MLADTRIDPKLISQMRPNHEKIVNSENNIFKERELSSLRIPATLVRYAAMSRINVTTIYIFIYLTKTIFPVKIKIMIANGQILI